MEKSKYKKARDNNINMTISPSKRKHENDKEEKATRKKLDIQILHDTEAGWLVDPVATEQRYIREYEETDSESCSTCAILE